MKISINGKENLCIADIQKEFETAFPYLKIEFFRKKHKSYEGSPKADLLDKNTPINKLTSRKGSIEIHEDLTVNEVEKIFEDAFGLHVQIFRKSGKSYLETSVTDGWTLKKQNEVGKEISELSS
ncbi:MAG: hypothetical protein N3F09_03955 [Bacteroidia bacterium]|nr:hypothetical protein [Bacteroidia bacterium]